MPRVGGKLPRRLLVRAQRGVLDGFPVGPLARLERGFRRLQACGHGPTGTRALRALQRAPPETAALRTLNKVLRVGVARAPRAGLGNQRSQDGGAQFPRSERRAWMPVANVRRRGMDNPDPPHDAASAPAYVPLRASLHAPAEQGRVRGSEPRSPGPGPGRGCHPQSPGHPRRPRVDSPAPRWRGASTD